MLIGKTNEGSKSVAEFDTFAKTMLVEPENKLVYKVIGLGQFDHGSPHRPGFDLRIGHPSAKLLLLIGHQWAWYHWQPGSKGPFLRFELQFLKDDRTWDDIGGGNATFLIQDLLGASSRDAPK